MPRTVDRYVPMALQFWERGRRYEDQGRPVLASRSYTRGLGCFLSYVKLAQDVQLAPAYYAFGTLGRELARLLAPMHRLSALQNARMALAASHLADPTRGQAGLIRRAVRDDRGRGMYQLTLDRRRLELTPEVRIAGAADARDLLASLLGTGPTRRSAQGRWPIGSGARLGRGRRAYWQEKKRYMQAVLPSCAGLDERRERARLRQEADAFFAELRRVAPGFDPGPRPEREKEEVQRRLHEEVRRRLEGRGDPAPGEVLERLRRAGGEPFGKGDEPS
ncbi:hypothetical protein SSP35_26_00030 [Streptomyces sp. NBRC 110611]|uniref:hypothetical protein n=1 Tax=Streptomyces sp. NBRC 110611 TaxID=1621259 RepID=UPI00082BAA12|nr:hypothetical protein [Streptomyces sp. NBRC 110611]GAU71032.1 hypothetical protein SSP35_26_00030 [Streptomyces sp. NBRC 110611]